MFLLLAAVAAAEPMPRVVAVLVATSINKVFQSLVRLRSSLVQVELVEKTALQPLPPMVRIQSLARLRQLVVDAGALITVVRVPPVALVVAVDSFQVLQPTEQVVKATLAATEATSGAVVQQLAAEAALVVREHSETRLTATAAPVCLTQLPARRVGTRLAVAVVVGVW
jgi:hypothetical protein